MHACAVYCNVKYLDMYNSLADPSLRSRAVSKARHAYRRRHSGYEVIPSLSANVGSRANEIAQITKLNKEPKREIPVISTHGRSFLCA